MDSICVAIGNLQFAVKEIEVLLVLSDNQRTGCSELLLIFFFNIAIVNRVRERENPPFRPLIPSSYGDGLYVKLMYSCWEEDPCLRPKFSEITQTIKKINNGK